MNEITRLLRNKVRLLDMCTPLNCSPEVTQEAIASGSSLAEELEKADPETIRKHLQSVLHQINVQPESITMQINLAGLTAMLGLERSSEAESDNELATISLPIQLRRRGVEARLVLTEKPNVSSNIDPTLMRLLGQAHSFFDKLSSGEYKTISELATATGSNAAEISRILPLAFLAPQIVRAFVDGRQPAEVTAESLKRLDHVPYLWNDQCTKLGFFS